LVVVHDTATVAPAPDDNTLVEQLGTTIAQVAAAQLTAVTFELGRVSVTVRRVDALGRRKRKARRGRPRGATPSGKRAPERTICRASLEISTPRTSVTAGVGARLVFRRRRLAH
jgi:hypothetical protein